MAKIVRQTVIIVPQDHNAVVQVSTNAEKWLNRMLQLVEAGVAEEVESSVEGSREFELEHRLVRLPFNRKSRDYTPEQREAARDRLAAVRAAVLAAREEEEEEEEEPAPKKKGKAAPAPAPVATKKVAKAATKVVTKAPATKKVDKTLKVTPFDSPGVKANKKRIIEEEIEDEEEDVEDEMDDEEEIEEVVVKKPAKKALPIAPVAKAKTKVR